ncbi:DNA polymerase [Thermodesulfobacteriota bacterium]
MEIYSSTEQIKNLSIFAQGEHPVALTPPLITDQDVLVGLYCELTGPACMHLEVHEFADLKSFLYDPQWFRLLSHGIKRIWEELDVGNLETHTHLIADTEIMSYLLDSGRAEQEYSLSYLARRYLDINYPNRSAEICDKDFPESVYGVLVEDAYLIWELGSVLLDGMDADQRWLYFYGELKIAMILNEMSRYGIPVDGDAAAQMNRDTLIHTKKLEDEIQGGEDLNLWDGSHVYDLFKDREPKSLFRPAHRSKEVPHSDLKQISHSSGLAARIIEWRDLQTDLSFLKAAAGKSRINPRWSFMTKTSRITASNPAVQNVTKIRCRPLMHPGPGWVMIKADYRQVQMRLLVNMTNDPELVSAFRQGLDVHWLTVEMCGIQGATDKERRDKAKAVNFGILFQMTADGLSRELGTDRKTAQGYIDAFWQKYSSSKEWLDDFLEELKQKEPEERVVRSALGRTRRFEGEFGMKERRRAKATLLQQEEADLLRMAVMRLYARFRDLGMKSRVVMTIHDAVYVEAPEGEAVQARTLMKEQMEAAAEMPVVPLEIDIE